MASRKLYYVFPDAVTVNSSSSSRSAFDGLDHEPGHYPTADSFVETVAGQIELVDTLREAGLQADGYLGYSIGQMSCAYIDGTYSRLELLQMAYILGKACDESGTERNQLNSKQMDFLWSTVTEAMFSVTSRAVGRSRKWVSTSCDDTEDMLRICSPRYFIEMLTKPVQFKSACQSIPSDALVLEVTPSQGQLCDHIIRNCGPKATYFDLSALACDPNNNAIDISGLISDFLAQLSDKTGPDGFVHVPNLSKIIAQPAHVY
jgi:acyl transferase domain-containing protein